MNGFQGPLLCHPYIATFYRSHLTVAPSCWGPSDILCTVPFTMHCHQYNYFRQLTLLSPHWRLNSRQPLGQLSLIPSLYSTQCTVHLGVVNTVQCRAEPPCCAPIYSLSPRVEPRYSYYINWTFHHSSPFPPDYLNTIMIKKSGVISLNNMHNALQHAIMFLYFITVQCSSYNLIN